jgi:hypothetical protein
MDYKKIYDALIFKARSENRSKNRRIYYEAHHILPRCLGGQGHSKQWKNHPNIILLTAKEHWVAHLLLAEIYSSSKKLYIALKIMMDIKKIGNRDYVVSGAQYDRIKLESSEVNRQIMLSKGPRSEVYRKNISKSKMGELNPSYGKKSHRSIAIIKISKDGDIIAEYENSYRAAESVEKATATKVIACCKGKRHTHMGFIWKYKK